MTAQLLIQGLGGVLILLGIYLVLARAMGTEGSVELPGFALNVPASVLVLILGVAVFLFPFSPWWPGTDATTPDGPPTASPSPDTPEPSPSPPGTATPKATLPASLLEDCIDYDPDTLELEDLGEAGWRLNSSRSAMVLLDNRDDAEKALALAELHTQRCFIGRDNSRPERQRYIVTYWTGPDGAIVNIPAGAIPDHDCIGYDPTSLSIEDLGAQGWRLNSATSAMLLADSQRDARRAQELASHYDQHCFIGRDNDRGDRFRYIETYWSN